jgi:hypothetical protein
MTANLKSLFTPELFKSMMDKWIPFSKTDHVNFAKVIQTAVFAQGIDRESVQRLTLLAVKSLSLLGLENVPDLLEFFRDPKHADFAPQALALQLVLKGFDARWPSAYFCEIASHYAQRLQSL